MDSTAGEDAFVLHGACIQDLETPAGAASFPADSAATLKKGKRAMILKATRYDPSTKTVTFTPYERLARGACTATTTGVKTGRHREQGLDIQVQRRDARMQGRDGAVPALHLEREVAGAIGGG